MGGHEIHSLWYFFTSGSHALKLAVNNRSSRGSQNQGDWMSQTILSITYRSRQHTSRQGTRVKISPPPAAHGQPPSSASRVDDALQGRGKQARIHPQ